MFSELYKKYKNESEKEFIIKKQKIIEELLKISNEIKELIINNKNYYNLNNYNQLMIYKKHKLDNLKYINYALYNIKNKKFENLTYAKQFQKLPKTLERLKIINKYIKKINISKNEYDNETFGIYIDSYYEFEDKSKLRINSYIPIEEFKKNSNWILKNICFENIESNLNSKNKNIKIILTKDYKFKYKNIETYDLTQLIRLIIN